jgi:hypothetical protein
MCPEELIISTMKSLLLAIASCLFLLAVPVLCQDFNRYTNCIDCVSAGYGWSLEHDQCGKYANRDCSLEADMEAEDEEVNNNYQQNTQQQQQQQQRQSYSNHHQQHSSDDDEDEEDDIEVESTPRSYQWADTEITTHLWQLVSRANVEGLQALIDRDPNVVHERSADGRGALFWAYEYDQPQIVQLLVNAGADENAKDKNGDTPQDLAGQARGL